MKALARMQSGHQVNLDDQVLACGPHLTATQEPAPEAADVTGGVAMGDANRE